MSSEKKGKPISQSKEENPTEIDLQNKEKSRIVYSPNKDHDYSNQIKENKRGYNSFEDEEEKKHSKALGNTLPFVTLRSRQNTDLVCFVFFFILLFAQIGLGGYAIYMNFSRLNTIGAPMDPAGNYCGVGEARKYPFIYWVNPISENNLHRTVCVKTCLNNTRTNFQTAKLECFPNAVVPSCEFKANMFDINNMILYYDTVEFLGKVCLPKSTSYLKNSISVMRPPTFHIWMKDIRTTFLMIMLSFIGTIILGFIFVFFTRMNTKAVVWIFIIFYLLSLLLIAVYFLYQSQNTQPLNTKNYFEEESVIIDNAREGILSKSWNFGISIAAFSFAILSLFLIICFRHKVSLTVDILDTASDFIDDNQAVMLVPFLSFFLIFSYFAFWILVAGCLFMGEGNILNTDVKNRFPFSQHEIGNTMTILLGVHAALAVYFVSFIINLTNYIISTCFSLWYFKFDPDLDLQIGRKSVNQDFTTESALRLSFKSAFYKHWGSISFGSFIMIPFGLPAWILMILRETCQSLEKKYSFCHAIFSVCCCVTNIYKLLFYWITSNAYVIVGLHGKSFRESGLRAATIIDINFKNFSESSSLSGIFILLGNLFITTIVVLTCYIFLEFLPYYVNKLNSSIFPLVIISLFSFFTSYCFMTLYATAVDSNLLCYFIEMGDISLHASVKPRSSRKIKHYIEKHSPFPQGHKRSLSNFMPNLDDSNANVEQT